MKPYNPTQLYRLYSALRGPDDASSPLGALLKDMYTARIRSVVFQSIGQVNQGGFPCAVTSKPLVNGTRNLLAFLERNTKPAREREWNRQLHFNYHLSLALEVLYACLPVEEHALFGGSASLEQAINALPHTNVEDCVAYLKRCRARTRGKRKKT